jgi:hypothetical protein
MKKMEASTATNNAYEKFIYHLAPRVMPPIYLHGKYNR